jgi:PKD repeat protein
MKIKNFSFFTLMLLGSMIIFSCGKDDPDPTPNPVSSFQLEISESNFLEVTFSNFSANATSYAWDFGDGASSTEENPVHEYGTSGEYTITLTATNSEGSAMSSKNVTLVDPNEASKLLTGDVSKTWKLYREGTALSLGPDASNPAGWWAGLSNNGARPCLYSQTFTFFANGDFVFDDMGMFWGENDPWAGTALHETCFEPTAANMVNKDGADVSAWASGTHSFNYESSTGEVTLTGMGAWMGLVHAVGLPDLYSNVPTASRTFNIEIAEETGYDLMTLTYDYGADGLWTCRYVSYSDPSLEPDIVTEEDPFGEDLDDISPTELFFSFASKDASEIVLLDTIGSGAQISIGVDDPADPTAAKVGEYYRTPNPYQELQFQTAPDKFDINFENLSTVSLEVYIPSSNDYSGDLNASVIIGLADRSQTEQWWTDNREYSDDGTTIEMDKWVTLSYPLDMPNAGAGTYTPYDRNDLDMIYISIGGGGHSVPGLFYIRNLKFE